MNGNWQRCSLLSHHRRHRRHRRHRLHTFCGLCIRPNTIAAINNLLKYGECDGCDWRLLPLAPCTREPPLPPSLRLYAICTLFFHIADACTMHNLWLIHVMNRSFIYALLLAKERTSKQSLGASRTRTAITSCRFLVQVNNDGGANLRVSIDD